MRHVRLIGDAFERAAMRIEVGTDVPFGGLLTTAGSARRCQLLEMPHVHDRPRGPMLRLRVRGDAMSEDGIRDGDYLVLDARGCLRDGQTVLADDGGCTVVRRVRPVAGTGDEIRLEPPATAGKALPLLARGRPERIHGAIVGILRKALRRGRAADARAAAPVPGSGPPVETVQRLRILQRSLHSVRTTYRTTRHPRLRRALRDEAKALAREMARERDRLGEGVGEVVLLN